MHNTITSELLVSLQTFRTQSLKYFSLYGLQDTVLVVPLLLHYLYLLHLLFLFSLMFLILECWSLQSFSWESRYFLLTYTHFLNELAPSSHFKYTVYMSKFSQVAPSHVKSAKDIDAALNARCFWLFAVCLDKSTLIYISICISVNFCFLQSIKDNLSGKKFIPSHFVEKPLFAIFRFSLKSMYRI
jgi:hypothetical protein